MFRRLMTTNAPAAVFLIRLMVGFVFLSEGIQKFLFPESVGPGRFAKIGFSSPEFVASFVAVFEITCGSFIAAGVLTRLAVLPTITIMIVAITATKIPILRADGFWKMAHEARTDYSMLLGSLFLLFVGAGSWSLDFVFTRKMRANEARSTPPEIATRTLP
jgi:putative oxidoreductase